MINLYNMDCMEALQAAPDNYWDLAIVDPPYGINMAKKLANGWASKSGGVKYKSKNWDKKTPDKKYFDELLRVSKNQIIWGANYFIDKIILPSPCWLVWDKKNGKSFFADVELAYTSFKTPCRLKQIHWCGSAAIHETGLNKIHVTQKPIGLYTWLLSKYAKKGDKILDTHLGSGSSAIAAHQSGYDFWGYEIDKDYFNAASKRLQEVQRQLLLF